MQRQSLLRRGLSWVGGKLAAAGRGIAAGWRWLTGGRAKTGADAAPPHDAEEEKKKTLVDRYGYESDKLSDEDVSDDEFPSKSLLRYHGKTTGKKTEFAQDKVALTPEKTVKRTARSIRRYRRDEATEKDEKPILTRFSGGGMVEVTPTPKRKDVGVYPISSIPDRDAIKRSNARPYKKLGSDLDHMTKDEGLTHTQVNEDLYSGLMGQPRRHATQPTSHALLDETQGVLMSDMARGSQGPQIVQDMLNNNSDPFATRFHPETGTYEPARRGGSSFLQQRTEEEKKKKMF